MAEQARENNPNWRGGRVVDPRGYVLVRVGTDHHLADVRGYAYEHRVVAEEKLGRRLLPGEIAHHKDEDKTNNHPDNIEVVASHAEHHVLHRKADSALRLPGEPNPVVPCACGCGATFERYDESGRSRRFVSGHNPPRAVTMDRILAALREGPKTHTDLFKAMFTSPQAVIVCLSKMKRRGLVAKGADKRWYARLEQGVAHHG